MAVVTPWGEVPSHQPSSVHQPVIQSGRHYNAAKEVVRSFDPIHHPTTQEKRLVEQQPRTILLLMLTIMEMHHWPGAANYHYAAWYAMARAIVYPG